MDQDGDRSRTDLSILVPVYNEGENVAGVLRQLAMSFNLDRSEVLILYDFDEDDTVPVVRGLQDDIPALRLVRNDIGPGVVNALRKGFEEARGSYALVMMADGSDEPQAIDLMLAKARAGADVVAGSRYMRGGGQRGGPLLKRTMSRTAGLSLYWLRRLPIHDATSNFRLYSRRLLDRVEIESRGGFELALELTVKARRLGLRVDEVPTVWHDRTAGRSRFRILKWLPHYLRWYWVGMGVGPLRRRAVVSGQPAARSSGSGR